MVEPGGAQPGSGPAVSHPQPSTREWLARHTKPGLAQLGQVAGRVWTHGLGPLLVAFCHDLCANFRARTTGGIPKTGDGVTRPTQSLSYGEVLSRSMSETSFPRDNDEFEPYAEVDAAAPGVQYEGTNVCRAAALAMFAQANGRDFSDISAPLRQLGFYEPPGFYAQALQYGQAIEGIDSIPPYLGTDLADDAQVVAWSTFAETGDVEFAWVYLVSMLDSTSERASAVAAAAILRIFAPAIDIADLWAFWVPSWVRRVVRDVIEPYDLSINWTDDAEVEVQQTDRPSIWMQRAWHDLRRQLLETFVFLDAPSILMVAAWVRLRLAMTSVDEVVREFGHAALYNPALVTDGPDETIEPPETYAGALTVSTIVHGTRAWKGSWWRPGGDFHDLVLARHRSNLYNRGARFSWSGALSQRQRIIAANDFADWIGEVAPNGLQTVFAHSYGGEVASRAALSGVKVHEAVLLSVPAEPSACALAKSSGTRVVDIRTPFDPILALAGRGQRIDGIEPVLLPWRLGHSASHKATVWEKYDLASLARI